MFSNNNIWYALIALSITAFELIFSYPNVTLFFFDSLRRIQAHIRLKIQGVDNVSGVFQEILLNTITWKTPLYLRMSLKGKVIKITSRIQNHYIYGKITNLFYRTNVSQNTLFTIYKKFSVCLSTYLMSYRRASKIFIHNYLHLNFLMSGTKLLHYYLSENNTSLLI